MRKLVEWADVLCENFAPGPMERFGMSWNDLREINPRLVMASGCLFGQTGPHRSYPGFGAQGSALSGFNHLTGWADRASTGPSGTITDSLAPRYVALAIVGALLERERTGRGQYIDLSQVETHFHPVRPGLTHAEDTAAADVHAERLGVLETCSG